MYQWIRSNVYYLVTCFLFAILFFNIGSITSISDRSKSVSSDYPYLAPRLFDKEKNDLIINFTQLREVMKQRHAQEKVPLGIYFEYLPSGSSIGVNDQLEVEIGSLGKVPAVMAVYKNIEAGHLNLTDSLVLKNEHLDNLFGGLWQKGAGERISVREAIRLAMVESDNTAINVLLDVINEETQDDVFDELDLPKTTDGLYPIMSPKSYASVFRNLYLSAYLDYANSNSILSLLTETKFSDKLPAGLPKNVKMSHKIGVFTQPDGQTVYNDCGIVYVPERPYILCIMAATDEQTARKEMIAYAKMVYSFVSQVPFSDSSTQQKSQ